MVKLSNSMYNIGIENSCQNIKKYLYWAILDDHCGSVSSYLYYLQHTFGLTDTGKKRLDFILKHKTFYI